MTDSNALGEQQLGSQHGAPKQGYEAQPEQHHLHAALTRSAIIAQSGTLGLNAVAADIVY